MSSLKAKAFSLLARRAYFSKELREKLLEKGEELGKINALMDQLSNDGWIDDEDLAKRLVCHYQKKGYGPLWIRQKLKQRAGFVLSSIESDLDALKAWVEKKHRNKLKCDRQKVIASILRRGFSYQHAHLVVEELLAAIPKETEKLEI